MIHNMENGVAAAAVSSQADVSVGQVERYALTDVRASSTTEPSYGYAETRENNIQPPATAGDSDKTATIYAGDYLNKLAGESVERECRRKISEGATELVVNFSKTEIVNSIGVSILLGVIDAATSNGARVVFSDVNENTAELFEMLGLTNHVVIRES